MTRRDPNTIDLTQQRLWLAEDVRVWPVQERGELVYRFEIPSQHKFFRVGREEYIFISLLDGKTTVPQACGLAASVLGSDAPTAAQAEAIQRWLLSSELAYLEADGPPVRRSSFESSDGRGKFWSHFNPFWMKLPLPQAHSWLDKAAEKLTWLVSPGAMAIGVALIVVGMLTLVANWDEFTTAAAEIFSGENGLWLLGTWVALKLIHELGHAVACHRQGCTVRETGLVFILFAPLAYVDVTSCWRLNSRASRIVVAAAGMYVELLIAAIAVLLWATIDSPRGEFLLRNLILSAGLSTLLFNANALMRFDGYFILADLIEVPNLYAEGSTAVRRMAKRIFCGLPGTPCAISDWRRHFVALYGIVAMGWRITICLSLAIAASTMFAGAGVLIAALGIGLWFGKPLQQLIHFSSQLHRQDPARWFRGAATAGAIALGTWGVIWQMPLPTAVTVPAVAAYRPETLVRSGAAGFVKSIHVRDSQSVRQGDLLLEVENRELVNRLRQVVLAVEQNDVRARQAAQAHDASMELVLRENGRALAEQRNQLRRQVEGLVVTAPRDGRVIDRQLAVKIGTYVEEGDPLLWVAAVGEKEMVAVVDQDSIQTVRLAVGKPVRIRTASFALSSGRLSRIDPRASDLLPDESLAATEGGPLSVRPRGEQDHDEDTEPYRLLEPHFQARVTLADDVARDIPAGMRVTASFGYRAESIATRIRTAVRRMWHAAQGKDGQ